MSRDLLAELGGQSLYDVTRIPPPPWLFEGLIRDLSVGALISPPHSLKSMLMLDMAICLDFELPLFGRYPAIRKGHRPFIFSVDGADWDMGRMATKLMIGHGIEPEQRKLSDIAGRWTQGIRVLDPKFWNPNDPKSSWLWRWHEEHGITILFIDTKLAATMVNENNALEAQVVNEHFKSIRDYLGIPVVYTHHTGKPTNEPRASIYSGRGSTADPGAADFQIVLNRTPFGNGQRLSFDWAKSRGDFPPELDYVDLIPVPTEERDPAGGPLTALRFVATRADTTDALMARLKEGPATREQLAMVLTANMTEQQKYNYVNNWLNRQKKSNTIANDGKGTWTCITS